METVCPLCQEELENSEHLLWSCGILQCVWSSLHISLPSFDVALDFKNRFVSTYLAGDGRQRRLISISLWCLWFHRNKLVHEWVKFSMSKVLGFIRGYDQDLGLIHKNLYPSSSLGKELWRPPDADVIKINFDASYVQEKKLAVTAALARDCRGEVVGANTYLLEDVGNAFVAEARACERALLIARMMGFRRLLVEGDSLSVIKYVQKKGVDRSVLRPITFHIQQLHLLFDEVTYNFVHRTVNNVTHVLALEGRKRRVCGNWADSVPESVRLEVKKDWLLWSQRV